MKTSVHIILNSYNDAIAFHSKALECTSDLNLRTGHYYIDAKSILGVIGAGIGRTLTLESNCHETEDIKEKFDKFII